MSTMSLIKNYYHELLTCGGISSTLPTYQVSENMEHHRSTHFQLASQSKLRLTHHGISFTEEATGDSLQVSAGFMNENQILIQNGLEDYIKLISSDPYLKENRLFLEEIYQHLHLALMAEDMTEESCKLQVVKTDT